MKYWIYIICEDKYITMSPFGDIYPLSLIWVKIESKNNSVLTTNVLCNIKLESVMTILFKTILYLYFHLDQIFMVYTSCLQAWGQLHCNVIYYYYFKSFLLLLLLLLQAEFIVIYYYYFYFEVYYYYYYYYFTTGLRFFNLYLRN